MKRFHPMIGRAKSHYQILDKLSEAPNSPTIPILFGRVDENLRIPPSLGGSFRVSGGIEATQINVVVGFFGGIERLFPSVGPR